MAFISVTYPSVNSQSSPGSDIAQNFKDLTDGLSDGTKTLNVAAIVQTPNILSQILNRGSATSLSTGVAKNITASPLALTVGYWAIQACVGFLTAAATSRTILIAATSASSATIGGSTSYGAPDGAGNFTCVLTTPGTIDGGGDTMITLPTFVFRATVATNLFLVAQGNFTVSTISAFGSITAFQIG